MLIKFHESPFSGNRIVHADGQTDRHDEVNSRLLQFANVPINYYLY